MDYLFPFGMSVHSLVQEDQSPKKAFVLGVYASAVHARWVRGGETVCAALAVASEPGIFWNGDPSEAAGIISRIDMPAELGRLVPAGRQLNGPSARALDEHILAPLGLGRRDVWLCDCLPEARLNPNQAKVIRERYDPLIETYGLNPVTVPERPKLFCDDRRAAEITGELLRSQADTIILLGDIPIAQYLKRVSDVRYSSLREYTDMYGYGKRTGAVISGRPIDVIPLAHPRQVGRLGAHSELWSRLHEAWEAGMAR